MTVSQDIRDELMAAVRDAKIKIIGQDLVKNDAEARALTVAIKAYGDSPAGFIYAAPSRANSTLRPPDVVICHPEVGLLTIEVKGKLIEDIEGVEAGSIFIRYRGMVTPENVIRQAEDQMFEISAAIQKIIRSRRLMPLDNCMVAFPNISESDWTARGYDKAHPNTQLLFREQIETTRRFKQRISNLVKEGLAASGRPEPLNVDQLSAIQQVFGNSDVINEKRAPRSWVEKERLGSYIDQMAVLEKYLSEEQKDLSRVNVDGSQRLVRGVAGSGKSVVLANQVARFLHRRLTSLDGDNGALPTSIAVTCFNHALVEFLKRKIRTAYREQTLTENIPADAMLVAHFNNIMWQLIKERNWPINYIRVKDFPDAAARANAYHDQIQQFARQFPDWYETLLFDAVFVDEGQDFEPAEFQVLLDLIRPHPDTGEKTLAIFYDDAQNLYGRSRPNWREIGINVAVGDRARVMRECFRNTREIVELAFNVLLGTQAPPDTRVQTRTYADVAYLKERELIEEVGDHFRVRFAERTYQAPHVHEFPARAAEIDWLAAEIAKLINEEKVRPEDMLILMYKPSLFDYQNLEATIRRQCPALNFVHPFGESADKDNYIFQSDCLTVSTVYGAKGYDTHVVFLVGTDTFETNREGRAGFYVGATRAKLLLYVTGVEKTVSLLHEAQLVRQVI